MKVLGIILLILLILAIAPWLLMISWNYVMPYLFNFKEIGFWHSVAMIVVSSIIFGKNISIKKEE